MADKPLIIFSHPKPFRPDTTPVQTVAFRSWREAFPWARIFLYGREEGTEDICRETGLEYAGPVGVEPKSGAALVADLFQKIAAQKGAMNMFINSDIVLGPRASQAFARLASLPGPWLASGRRYCLPPFQQETFVTVEGLQSQWATHRRWGEVTALDYFVWKNFDLADMPDFVIGHCAWDNWMIYQARQRGIPVIDATADMDAYHFDHGYEYSKGNTCANERKGPLEERNLRLLGGDGKRFHLGHATHALRGGQLQKRTGTAVWQRNLELWRLQNPRWERAVKVTRSILHPLIRAWEKNTAAKEMQFR